MKSRLLLFILAGFFTLCVASAWSSGPVFYVSPEGSDAADGLSLETPFATLEKARDAVRDLLDAGETRTITVRLRGGRYVLEAPLVLGLQDGARVAGQQIVYEAAEGETPVLTSLMPIEGWAPVATLPEHVPPEAKGRLYRADIGAIADARRNAIAQGHSALWDWRIKVLYRDGTQVPRAKGDRFDPEVMHNTPVDLRRGNPMTLAYPEGVMRDYPDVQSAELHIIPWFDWSMNILPVDFVDENERVVGTAVPGTYQLGVTWKWKLRPCAWFENVPWGMRPGHWLLDSMDEVVYYWSKDGSPPEGIGASNGLLETIRVEGEIDYRGPEDIPVRGLVFRGLTFTEGARYTFPPDYKGGRWQHDWASYDEADGLLRFRGAEDCVVEKCRFINSAANGVRLDLHAQNITIRENEFGHLGECGVVLSGYGPGTKNVNRGNTVENNWFHHGAEHHWHASAIFVAQSADNRIRHNLIHDYSYNGITVTGLRRLIPNANYREQRAESQRTVRWHEIDRHEFMEFPDTIPYMAGSGNLIEANEILRVMERLGDGNAIYLSCAGEGNVVRGNYIHHIRMDAASAMRSDDAQWYVLYENNVIYNTTGHGIILKGPNTARNNFIVNQKDHFLPAFPGSIYIALREGPYKGIEVTRNVFAQLNDRAPRFYFLTRPRHIKYPGIELDEIENATMNQNLFWWDPETTPVATPQQFQREYGFDLDSLVADPLFRDPQSGDFSFLPGSPAVELGIEPIDVSGTGLTGAFRDQVYHPSAGRVTIDPGSQVFTGPVRIRMEVDPPGAEIRYTLDGTKPTESSTRYQGSFVLDHPATIRAQAFRSGAVDWLGARTDLWRSTQPVVETFERESDGRARSRMKYGGDTVSLQGNPDPARTGEALRLKDDGTGNRFQPLIYYQVVHGERDVEFSFDVWLGRDAELTVQWTDDPAAGPGRGTRVMFHPDGTVTSPDDRATLGRIEPETWQRVSIRLPLGGRDTIHPALLLDGRQSEDFPRTLAAQRKKSLDRIILSSSGQVPAEIYLDNIRIVPVSE